MRDKDDEREPIDPDVEEFDDDDDEDDEAEDEEVAGCHSTHPTKRPAAKGTPVTAPGNASKKQRVGAPGKAPASASTSAGGAGSSLDVD